jgi:hypothetical protein
MSTINTDELGCILVAKDALSKTNSEAYYEVQQTEYPHKWDKPIVTYSLVRGSEDLPGDSMESLALNLAMTTWDIEIPTVLDLVKKNENPDITLEFADKENDPFFKERPTVLAYAYYPKTSQQGVIRFSDEHIWSLDGKPIPAPYDPTGRTKFKTYNLLHTLIHEIGHSMGLKHSEGSGLEKTVMYLVAIYGSRQWAHPAHYARMKKWIKYRTRRFDSAPASSQEVEKLRDELQFAKSELDKKNAIIMEQMKVIMDLAKKIK